MPTKNTKAIVLAAGKGVRMKSDRPKILHHILGVPAVQYVLEGLREAGVDDVTLVVGHEKDQVQAVLGDACRYVVQPELKGTGDAVARCTDVLQDFAGDVLVLNADNPLVPGAAMKNMIELRRQLNASCIMFTACLEDPSGYGRVVRDSDGKFVKITEETDASDKERYIFESNSGAYCFSAPDLLAALPKVKPDNKKNELYITEVPRILAEEGKKIETLRAKDPTEVFGINTRRDLVAASNFLRWKIIENHLDNGVTVVDPSTTLIEADVEIGRDTIIEPFAILRRGTRIGRNCHVGPFCQLRGGADLRDGAEIGNFVEVKKSTVGPRSKAKHLAYIGDAELGADVNIGAGTITANYDGKKKHKTIIGDGVHTGSNSVLVAPVTIGAGVRTGAGAVVPKGKVAPGALIVGVPAKVLSKKGKGESGR